MGKFNFYFIKICINIEEYVLWKFRYMLIVFFFRIGLNYFLFVYFDIGYFFWLVVIILGVVFEFDVILFLVLWIREFLVRESML